VLDFEDSMLEGSEGARLRWFWLERCG
jgi:hypothetical protein